MARSRRMAHAGGRLVLLLEGGYDAQAVGEAVAETWRGLLGLPSATAGGDEGRGADGEEASAEVEELLGRVRRLHGLQG